MVKNKVSELELLKNINYNQRKSIELRNKLINDYEFLTKKLFWEWKKTINMGFFQGLLGLVAGIMLGIALAL